MSVPLMPVFFAVREPCGLHRCNWCKKLSNFNMQRGECRRARCRNCFFDIFAFETEEMMWDVLRNPRTAAATLKFVFGPDVTRTEDVFEATPKAIVEFTSTGERGAH